MLILMIVPGLSLFIDNLTYLADTLKKKKFLFAVLYWTLNNTVKTKVKIFTICFLHSLFTNHKQPHPNMKSDFTNL